MKINRNRKKQSKVGLFKFLAVFLLGTLFFSFKSLPASSSTSLSNSWESSLHMTSLLSSSPIYPSHSDPDASSCAPLLKKYRDGELSELEGFSMDKSYITRTTTNKPFYFSTHDPKVDRIRKTSFEKGHYYEVELSNRVAETFDAKAKNNQQSIMLDVGGNIGWFSLVAAAHGASKIYTFEPNVANVVRFCESITLNDWRGIFFPVNKGVDKENKISKLYKGSGKNPGSASFSEDLALQNMKGHRPNAQLKDLQSIQTMELVTLDSFAERHGWFEDRPSIGFFKLDVEGYEQFVLAGAKKLLKSNIIEKIAMEMRPDHKTEEKEMIIELIFNAGYELSMHGGYLGPRLPVTKKYNNWKELADDVPTYKGNLLFTLRK